MAQSRSTPASGRSGRGGKPGAGGRRRSPKDQLIVDLVVTVARFTRATSQTSGSTDPVAVWRALSILEQYGPMRVGDFAVVDHCSQPTATMMLRRLEDAGAAQRVADPDDGRAVLLSLTPQGREQLEQLRDGLVKTLGPRLAEFTADEVDTLARAVPLIRRLMESDRDD